MAIDIDSLQTFSKSDLLKLCEHNIAMIHAGGQSKGMGGRNLTQADLAALYDIRAQLTQEIADEAGASSGANVLVRFGETS